MSNITTRYQFSDEKGRFNCWINVTGTEEYIGSGADEAEAQALCQEATEHYTNLLNCFGIIPAAADSAPTTCEHCGVEIAPAPALMTRCEACEDDMLYIEYTGQIPADITITCPDCNDALPLAPIDPYEFEEMWATDGPAAHRALAALTPGQLTMQALVFNAYLYGRYGWSESSSVWRERFERAAVWERHQQTKARGLSPTRLVARAISNLPPVAADKADPILEAQRLFFAINELSGKLYEHIQIYQNRSGFLKDPEYQALSELSNRVHALCKRANERANRRRMQALEAMRRASF